MGADATVGPFAYIRPGCRVGDETRIGDFVELKKASIGNGTKVSHLTYIGDATVGERVNFGCGTVVVNYDGYVKSQTVIGDDCFIAAIPTSSRRLSWGIVSSQRPVPPSRKTCRKARWQLPAHGRRTRKAGMIAAAACTDRINNPRNLNRIYRFGT
ncbi:hypothetical protein [Butyricicoccus porcorum]|uniref:hypothetical protein n=1 Tax=Butyricicoccus porcorum TaxID=1945634 RepID=UPI0013FD5436|nr:hypothetical protein [Butyricicoccus porcorum]